MFHTIIGKFSPQYLWKVPQILENILQDILGKFFPKYLRELFPKFVGENSQTLVSFALS